MMLALHRHRRFGTDRARARAARRRRSRSIRCRRDSRRMSPITGFALVYLLMRGFAEGCAAMTGTEAISNGVMAFKAPAQRNAATTLGWMVAILATFFLGVIVPGAALSGDAHDAGDGALACSGITSSAAGALYYALQYTTFAVLVLAANTAFADFPRLAGILANDRYMPRQLAARGDRLAFSNGIVTLAAGRDAARVAVPRRHQRARPALRDRRVRLLHAVAGGDGGALARDAEPGWRWKAWLNGIGAVATGLVVDHPDRHQVHHRRLDHRADHSADHPGAPRRSTGTTPNSRRRSGSRGQSPITRCITR